VRVSDATGQCNGPMVAVMQSPCLRCEPPSKVPGPIRPVHDLCQFRADALTIGEKASDVILAYAKPSKTSASSSFWRT
jgi:hypothetical protein